MRSVNEAARDLQRHPPMVAVENAGTSAVRRRTLPPGVHPSRGIDDVRDGDRVIERGDRGPGVRYVQELLNIQGSHLREDGDFGPKTERAVRAFQRSHGLEPDGIVGQRTLPRLERAARDAWERDRTVGIGDRGEDVKAAERRLKALGYDPGRVDGRYDRDTARAVREFKRDQNDIDNESGRLGKHGKDVLRNEARALSHDPYRQRIPKDRDRPRLDRATGEAAGRTNPDGTTGIGEGSNARVVRNVQAHLRSAGFDPKHTNGVFDERTEGMVRQFQRRSDLPVTGRVDEATWNKLQRSRFVARNATDPHQRMGERSGAVLRSERLLDKAGYDPGKVDGVFDQGTLRALHRFQHDHRRLGNGDGIGPNTLKAIEKAAKNPNQVNGLVKPVDAPLTASSEFRSPDAEGAPSSNGGRYHAAKDWFAPAGTPVRSPVDGKIVEVRASSGNSGQVFGGTVKVQGRDGRVWVFRHVDPANVRVGQQVNAGTRIAKVTNWTDGSDHTHVELWRTLSGGYRFENMIDPMLYLKRFL